MARFSGCIDFRCVGELDADDEQDALTYLEFIAGMVYGYAGSWRPGLKTMCIRATDLTTGVTYYREIGIRYGDVYEDYQAPTCVPEVYSLARSIVCN